MSLSKRVDVFCDACPQWYGEGEKTGRQVRKVARKRLGWSRIRGRDYCPDCTLRIRDEDAAAAQETK